MRPTFEHQLIHFLVNAHTVTKEAAIRQLESGDDRPIRRQNENVTELMKLLRDFDVKSVPREKRKSVEKQIARIKKMLLAYEESELALIPAYGNVVSAVKVLCGEAYPELVLACDIKLGLGNG